MRLFSTKTVLEVFNAIFINLTSAWFGIIFVAPGFFGVSSIGKYLELLTTNLPFAILGLVISLWLAEKNK